MPTYLIERNFAEKLQLGPDEAAQVKDINDDIGINWLFSFLSADQKKTYCIYEARDPEALREQARVLGIPADAIVEVSKLDPQEIAASA